MSRNVPKFAVISENIILMMFAEFRHISAHFGYFLADFSFSLNSAPVWPAFLLSAKILAVLHQSGDYTTRKYS